MIAGLQRERQSAPGWAPDRNAENASQMTVDSMPRRGRSSQSARASSTARKRQNVGEDAAQPARLRRKRVIGHA
eukprot:1686938-Rhodomonas_salina.2